jgi:hypothetical protein
MAIWQLPVFFERDSKTTHYMTTLINELMFTGHWHSSFHLLCMSGHMLLHTGGQSSIINEQQLSHYI